ncbi:tRNA-splicing ligase RtcB [uncultured archaeon]|nr:tRNA-splicing ligase RtcB [uncultured archaeon]
MTPKEIRPGVWEFREEGMRVPGRIYVSRELLPTVEEGVYRQVSNVAKLPGIVKESLAMPDAHYGYGFPIGGVAAFNIEEGVISPGGVGYDINCGVRLLTTNLTEKEVKPKLKELINELFDAVPCGLGGKSKLHLSATDVDSVLTEGAAYLIKEGMATQKDLAHTEENGRIKGANPSKVSSRAKSRGAPQCGTLGSGNHFLEIQRVDQILNEETAHAFGLNDVGQIAVMIHCGSRGLGYQVADDYISVMLEAGRRYGISLPDNELACAPVGSKEAEDYLAAMRCAVNYAFANRQAITHYVRQVFAKIFPDSQLDLMYDVCHNIAKFEEHAGVGEVCVHRKGATRAFAAGRKEIPSEYRSIGQPVIIPGSMGTASYVLTGTQTAMEETFGSTCHGAGRVMSRSEAKRRVKGAQVASKMAKDGMVVKAASVDVLSEEMPEAYKDVDEVIRSVELAGISRSVARLTPLGVVKG